jgi:ABC-type transport system involved in cytochrome c biogenesis ATPase subunit
MHDVCIEANKGDQVVIYGMNGGGKTTILNKILNATVRSNALQISVMQHICRDSRDRLMYKKWITYIYQLGIESVINKPITTLSSGQKKRLIFIEMLLAKRQIWLLDEPYNFIDNEAKTFIVNKMSEPANSNGIIIYTLNDWKSPENISIGLNGFEPLTFRLSSEHSKPLSYRPCIRIKKLYNFIGRVYALRSDPTYYA